MERVAECHCGQLRAITSGEPDSVYICHCKACQRRTGAVIHNGSRWLKSQVRIVVGRLLTSTSVQSVRVDGVWGAKSACHSLSFVRGRSRS